MNEQELKEQIQGLELKALAYKQELASKTEEGIDLRVRLTMLNDKNTALQSRVDELESREQDTSVPVNEDDH